MELIVRIKKKLDAFLLEADFVSQGGTLCLLGPSGSGKSVTLKCIAGLMKPDEGYIELNGKVLFDSDRRIDLPPQEREVGYLFQDYALFPTMTVYQNLRCGIRHRRLSSAEARGEIEKMMDLLQLRSLEHKKPGQLSGGERQRTALGRILLCRPQLLLLDEPFSALDSYLKDQLVLQMQELLKNLTCAGILVTHSREEAYALADRAAVIWQGKLQEVKPAAQLFTDPVTPEEIRMTRSQLADRFGTLLKNSK